MKPPSNGASSSISPSSFERRNAPFSAQHREPSGPRSMRVCTDQDRQPAPFPPKVRFATDTSLEGAGFEPSVPSSTGTRVRSVKLKKGVECKPDAEGGAWPTGRQQSQAMLFYGHAEPRIPGASNCGIISTVPPGFHSFVRGTDGSNPAFSSG